MMKCGHAPNGTEMATGKPVCVICGCNEIVKTSDFTNRESYCLYGCGAQVPSSDNLPFFEYRPNLKFDRYYCGCRGFD